MPLSGALVTVVTALLAATVTAFGTALQQRGAQTLRAPGRERPPVTAWLRNPRWVFGVLLSLSGFGIYLVALGHGALVLAQPVMIMAMVLGPVFAAWLARRRADRRLLAGGGLCAGGLAVALVAGRPGGTVRPPAPGDVTALVVGLVAVLLAASVVAVWRSGLPQALATALVAGVLFGSNAALAKLVVEQLAGGPLEPVRHPALYLMAVAAPTGFLLSQRAMRMSRVLAPVNAVMGSSDPLTAATIGVLAFGERIATAPGPLLALLCGVALVLVGIGVVAQRSAALLRADRAVRAGQAHPDGVLTWG